MDDHGLHDQPEESRERDGWAEPLPHTLPRPTYWPAVFALGSILILWGLITTLAITAVGGLLFLGSVAGWIGELRHEHRS